MALAHGWTGDGGHRVSRFGGEGEGASVEDEAFRNPRQAAETKGGTVAGKEGREFGIKERSRKKREKNDRYPAGQALASGRQTFITV